MRGDKSFRSASQKSSSRKKRGRYARRLEFESLEDRRALAATANFAAGVLTIDMPLANDDAVLTLNAGEYELNAAAIVGDPTPANVTQLVVTAFGAGNDFKLNADINPLNGINITDGGDVATVEINANITGVDTGQQVNIQSVTGLNGNIRTDGGSVLFNGPLTLLANAEIDTDVVGGTSKNAGEIFVGSVDGAFALKIDATTDDNATAGVIQLGDAGGVTALTELEARTEDRFFFFGNVIKTDGDVTLQAETLELANPDDSIDTEQGGDSAGGAVDLAGVGLIRNVGVTIPHVLRIDTRGTTKGAVTLPASGQFVLAPPTPGFTNYNDALFSAVRIQVATTQLFFENFALPTAAARFASTNFSQVGTQFVASPPPGKKAVATILPTEIVPAPPLPATYNVSAAVAITKVPGRFKNGFIVFDATDERNFKFAGAFFGRRQFSIGEVRNGVVIHRRTTPIAAGLTFNLSVDVNTTTGDVVLSNNGVAVVNHSFGTTLSPARLPGVGTNNAITNFSNIVLTG